MSLTRKQRTRILTESHKRYIFNHFINKEITEKSKVKFIEESIKELVTEMIRELQADKPLDKLNQCRKSILNTSLVDNARICLNFKTLGFKVGAREYIYSPDGHFIAGTYYPVYPNIVYFRYDASSSADTNDFTDLILKKADPGRVEKLKELLQRYIDERSWEEREKDKYSDAKGSRWGGRIFLPALTTWGQLEKENPEWAENLAAIYDAEPVTKDTKSDKEIDEEMKKLRDLEDRLGL